MVSASVAAAQALDQHRQGWDTSSTFLYDHGALASDYHPARTEHQTEHILCSIVAGTLVGIIAVTLF
jgi:hypothetical protein